MDAKWKWEMRERNRRRSLYAADQRHHEDVLSRCMSMNRCSGLKLFSLEPHP